jgi:hypothetical protein
MRPNIDIFRQNQGKMTSEGSYTYIEINKALIVFTNIRKPKGYRYLHHLYRRPSLANIISYYISPWKELFNKVRCIV